MAACLACAHWLLDCCTAADRPISAAVSYFIAFWLLVGVVIARFVLLPTGGASTQQQHDNQTRIEGAHVQYVALHSKLTLSCIQLQQRRVEWLLKGRPIFSSPDTGFSFPRRIQLDSSSADSAGSPRLVSVLEQSNVTTEHFGTYTCQTSDDPEQENPQPVSTTNVVIKQLLGRYTQALSHTSYAFSSPHKVFSSCSSG